MAANVENEVNSNYETPLESPGNTEQRGMDQQQIAQAVNSLSNACQEVMKAFRSEKAMRVMAKTGKANLHFSGKPVSVFSASQHSSDDWIVDNGASDHMTSYSDIMINPHAVEYPVHIILPDGSSKAVHTVGDVQLNEDLILKDVLYVPEFKYNLLSVSKLVCEGKLSAHFHKEFCVLQDHLSKRYLAIGRSQGGLFRIKSSRNKEEAGLSALGNKITNTSECNVLGDKDFELLHKRLGHVSVSKMLHIPGCQEQPKNDFFCDTCSLAKFHKLTCSPSVSYASNCFDLVHIDLWVPYKVASLNGTSYFLTIVDDHSRATWTYLLHNKQQVCDVLDAFIRFVRNQFGVTVKTVRTDNGT